YILLSVSHKDLPAAELRAGEAWISYEQIARDCGESGKQMRREAVARALTWLEEHGYIRRVVVKGRGQKIVVPNWDKYQGGTSSETELTPELAPELTPELADGTSSESELAAELAPELAAELKQEDQEHREGERRSTS